MSLKQFSAVALALWVSMTANAVSAHDTVVRESSVVRPAPETMRRVSQDRITSVEPSWLRGSGADYQVPRHSAPPMREHVVTEYLPPQRQLEQFAQTYEPAGDVIVEHHEPYQVHGTDSERGEPAREQAKWWREQQKHRAEQERERLKLERETARENRKLEKELARERLKLERELRKE